MRIAAFDLGSNSFHLLVVETRPDGSFVALVREKETLRLGDVVARDRRIGPEDTDRAVAVVRRFRAIAEAERATELIALGTAALREALNGGEVVDRIRSETGVSVEVVSGVREAHLIFEAVRASVLLDPGPALCADLGGGSLELIVGDRAGPRFATSLRLGVGRLTAEHVRSDPPSAKDRRRMRDAVDGVLVPLVPEIVAHGPKMLVGSSGTLLALARMAAARRLGTVPDNLNQLTVGSSDLRAVRDRLYTLPVEERARIAGMDSRRADIAPAGALVLQRLMALTGLEEMTVSEWALREGIVVHAIGRHEREELGDDPRGLRRGSVLALCRRCNWRQRHSRQTARLATQLFDGTGPAPGAGLHSLGSTDRELLELGTLLHDIGEHVSREGHDRHGSYLVENAGLRGFDPDEVRVLSCLVRYHLRSTPRASFPAFGALAPDWQRRTTELVALLRVVDALDRSHASVVDRIRVEGHGRRVIVRAVARGEAELELWGLRRKKSLFEELFGVSLEVVIESTGRDDWEAEVAEPA